MLLFIYTTTRKRFVIFTCRYFKLSWNTTALSQSNCRNFSCSSIIRIKQANLCSALLALANLVLTFSWVILVSDWKTLHFFLSARTDLTFFLQAGWAKENFLCQKFSLNNPADSIHKISNMTPRVSGQNFNFLRLCCLVIPRRNLSTKKTKP